MNDNVVKIDLRGAALEALRSHEPELLVSGAAGTGKSVGLLTKILILCLSVPNFRALIVRKTQVSLTASTLSTFRNEVAKEAIARGLCHFFGGSAQEPASFRFPSTGAVIVVGGLDRASRLLSTSFDIALVDEAVEVSPEDLDTIVTRLRHGAWPACPGQLLMATNPGPPTHHLKMRADTGRCRILHSTHEDNPRMHDGGEWTEYGQAYLNKLDSLVGAHYERMRWGKWVAAEGQIYEGFRESVHVVDRFSIPEDWELLVSIDFGYVNPAVFQFWRIDHDGRMYLEKEIYETKTLVEDHARNVLSILEQYPNVPHLREPQMVCDHDAEDRATLRKYLGYSPRRAVKAVEHGIQNMQARFTVQGDGKPRVFFLRDNVVKIDRSLREAGKPTSTIAELPQYVWDSTGNKGPKEAPLKMNDHGMDAMRYAAARLDRVRA